MLKVNFYPDSDTRDLNKATESYKKIWEREGKKIVNKIEEISGLKFKESFINAVVYLAKLPSRSYPLSLWAGANDKRKRSILVHELCHRILAGNRVKLLKDKFKDEEDRILEIHKLLNLILYDVWVALYGKKFAQKSVEIESNSKRTDIYKKAWNWALKFTKEERQAHFVDYIRKQKDI